MPNKVGKERHNVNKSYHDAFSYTHNIIDATETYYMICQIFFKPFTMMLITGIFVECWMLNVI